MMDPRYPCEAGWTSLYWEGKLELSGSESCRQLNPFAEAGISICRFHVDTDYSGARLRSN